MSHRAGFVNIIGNPNVGKSTLMNAFVGEKLSIITSKAQTTRHRILGIVNGDDFQVVLSDTPGIIKPAYELQESMMGRPINGHEPFKMGTKRSQTVPIYRPSADEWARTIQQIEV